MFGIQIICITDLLKKKDELLLLLCIILYFTSFYVFIFGLSLCYICFRIN